MSFPCPTVPISGTILSRRNVPFGGNATRARGCYAGVMASEPLTPWSLKDWLKDAGLTVAAFEAATGWTHRITSELVNNRIRWNSDHLATAARVLELAPHEVLMPPEQAKALRDMFGTATQIAADTRLPFHAAPPEAEQPGTERLAPLPGKARRPRRR